MKSTPTDTQSALETQDTPTSSASSLGLGLYAPLQLVPLYCSMSGKALKSASTYSPTAQQSVAETQVTPQWMAS